MKLFRVILPVKDIDAVSSFYADIFNQQGIRVSTGRHYFDLGGTILALYDPLADGDEIQTPWAFHENQYLYFSTDDLESQHTQFLKSNSIYVDSEITVQPWGERSFYVRDPFGNRLCFVDKNTIFTGT